MLWKNSKDLPHEQIMHSDILQESLSKYLKKYVHAKQVASLLIHNMK